MFSFLSINIEFGNPNAKETLTLLKLMILILVGIISLTACNEEPEDSTINGGNFKKVKEVGKYNDSLFFTGSNSIEYEQGKFFVEERENGYISVFDKDLKFLYKIGRKGRGPGEFTLLSDFQIYRDSIFAVSSGNSQMHVFDLQGSYSRTIHINGSFGNTLTVDKDGFFYGCLYGEGEPIVKFDKNGNRIKVFGRWYNDDFTNNKMSERMHLPTCTRFWHINSS